MRIVIAGAHGQIARRLGRLLAARGDTVVGLIRNPDHRADVQADGVEPAVLDLEAASVEEVAAVRVAAPTRSSSPREPARAAARHASTPSTAARPCCSPTPPSGPASARTCSSRPWASSRRGRAPRAGWTRCSPPTCRPSCARRTRSSRARSRHDDRAARVGLTDDPGTGRVTLEHGVESGEIPRDDVAAVLAEILTRREDRRRAGTGRRQPPRSPRPSPRCLEFRPGGPG